jgi:hypothetical protein
MLITYHIKRDGEICNGWHEVKTREHDSKDWDDTDLWAISHLLEHGSMVLTMGGSMWEVNK